MNIKIHARNVLLILSVLLFSYTSYSQLPAFTVSATSTPETCSGNGSISFTVSGTAPGASIDYKIYLLPDITNPVATVTSSPLLNRPAGNYLIVATQSVGVLSNTSSTTVTIQDLAPVLLYDVVPTNVSCGNDGKITVNSVSGTIVSYQLISGPVTRPVQASNVFANLPVGQYNVRVVSNCGRVEVRTVQLISVPPLVVIGAPTFGDAMLTACDKISVGNSYGTLSGSQIVYPLTFQYTVFPPGGGPSVIITQTISAGNASGGTLYTAIPFYNNEVYNYNLKVTDGCNKSYTRTNNIVFKKFDVAVETDNVNCVDNTFKLQPGIYMAPYTVTFTTAPATFTAANYNTGNVFSGPVQYGQSGNGVPPGNYIAVFKDACNRTVTKSFTVATPDPSPGILTTVAGCSSTGKIEIEIEGRDIVSVVFASFPVAYTGLPNVSAYITSGSFLMSNLPLGNYSITITDSCGESYTKPATLAVTGADPEMTVLQRPGCDEGVGSLRLSLPAGAVITNARITQAPSSFPHPLPYVVTTMAVGSNLFINSLPEGQYTFTTTDACNVTRTKGVLVEGYHNTVNNVTVIANCGSFDLKLQHTSNGNYVASYWLQRYNPVSGAWGDPETGNPYTEGMLPTLNNAIPLLNNDTKINLDYFGQFRVLKAFYSFRSGNAANQLCIDEIYNFYFDGYPDIINAYSFPCSTSGLIEVAIEAIGAAPLQYKITHKNGAPFAVNNGTSNVFSSLAPATYIFAVTDACGNTDPRPFTINELDPVAITKTGTCDGQPITLSVQPFSFLTYKWWKQGAPGTILSTQSVLTLPSYNSATQAGTYVVGITSTNPTSCMNTQLTVVVPPNVLPQAGNDLGTNLCNEGAAVNLASYLSAGHTTGGAWQDVDSTGALTGSQLATAGLAAGIYRFKYTVTSACSVTDDATITITLKDKPQMPVFTAPAPVCEGDAVPLAVTPVPGATYLWTGPNNFTSTLANPQIAAAGLSAAGNYRVTATVNGCTSAAATVPVTITAKPQFAFSGNTRLCSGQSTRISVVPGNFAGSTVNYQWYYNTVPVSGLTAAAIETTETGNWGVEVNNNGCKTYKDIVVSRNVIAIAAELQDGCDNNDAYVINIVNINEFPGAQFSWTGPNGYTSNAEQAVITGLEPGDYAVTITNPDGCTTQSPPVTVLNTFCKIPRGISPNGDEYNQSFDLTNLDVQEIKIFNRYGIEVYEKKNYKDEWHGQSNKGDLPTGTYYYVLALGSGKKVTGWVYLQQQI